MVRVGSRVFMRACARVACAALVVLAAMLLTPRIAWATPPTEAEIAAQAERIFRNGSHAFGIAPAWGTCAPATARTMADLTRHGYSGFSAVILEQPLWRGGGGHAVVELADGRVLSWGREFRNMEALRAELGQSYRVVARYGTFSEFLATSRRWGELARPRWWGFRAPIQLAGGLRGNGWAFSRTASLGFRGARLSFGAAMRIVGSRAAGAIGEILLNPTRLGDPDPGMRGFSAAGDAQLDYDEAMRDVVGFMHVAHGIAHSTWDIRLVSAETRAAFDAGARTRTPIEQLRRLLQQDYVRMMDSRRRSARTALRRYNASSPHIAEEDRMFIRELWAQAEADGGDSTPQQIFDRTVEAIESGWMRTTWCELGPYRDPNPSLFQHLGPRLRPRD
jgi:hypothetical protein